VLYGVFIEAIQGLLDKSVNDKYGDIIENTAMTVPGVIMLRRLKTLRTGRTIFAELEILVESGCSIKDAHGIGAQVREKLKAAVPELDDVVVTFRPGKSACKKNDFSGNEPIGDMI
jgi:divalent metal cation (Fe/Co/Zn/Cd) transporter